MSPAGVVKVDQIRYSNFGVLKASGSSTLPLGGANLPRAPFEVPTGGVGGCAVKYSVYSPGVDVNRGNIQIAAGASDCQRPLIRQCLN